MVLNKVIREIYPDLRRSALRIARRADLADDLLHTVLEDLLRSPAAAQVAEDKLPGYIYSAMRLSWVSPRSRYNRERRMMQTVELSDNLPEPPASDLSARWMNESCDLVISRLPELDATLLRLYVMPDFNYDHLALVTGIEKPYLYWLVQQAVRKAKRHVKNQGSE